ncbi:PQQ-binding-like beta-propeller repeat protein [Planctomycetaceae bacterium SH139]
MHARVTNLQWSPTRTLVRLFGEVFNWELNTVANTTWINNFLGIPAIVIALLSVCHGEDWLQFRGRSAAGVYAGEVPTQWGDSDNLKWITPLNGKGVSSPIVVGDRVFITTFSGFAQDVEKPGDISQLRRHLICIDRGNGEVLWQRSPPTRFPEDKFEGFIRDHGYASCTPASDGERVFAFFGKSGVFAFNMEGELLWQQFVGEESGPTAWGSGASPVVYKNLLLVNACDESQALIAFDTVTGQEKWRAEAKLYEGSYSTPVVGTAADGQDEIIVPLADEIWGIDPATGKLKWWVTESLGKYICTTPVVGDGIVYVAASSKVIAIRLGGHGDVTKTHTVWSRNAGPGVPSPVLDQDRLVWVGTNGILTCADAALGRTLWRKRIGDSSRNITYASLTKTSNAWLSMTQEVGTIAFRLEPEFAEISVNRFERDSTPFKSSFAAADGELFLRSDQFLYCISPNGRAQLSEVAQESPKKSITDAFSSIIASGRFFEGRSGNSVGPAQLLMTFDINNDDKISVEELAESPMPKFVQSMMMVRGDKNKDGFIDAEEREELQTAMKTKPGEVIGRKKAADRPERPPVLEPPQLIAP